MEETPEERIKIVHLVSSLNIGGLEMVVLDLVRNLNRDLFQVQVLCLEEIGALADRFVAAGVPVRNVGGSGRLGTIWQLSRRLSELRPHVLHSHNMSPHLRGGLASLLVRVPVLVHTKHGRNYAERRRSVAVNRFAARFSDCIVPVSDDAAAVALNIERVPPKKVRVIRNGIELGEFNQPAISANPGRAGLKAIHIARLNYIKDQATLLRAVRLAADLRPDFRLDLVGDGPERPRLEALCDELSLREHIRFLGFRSDVKALLAEAGQFVLSSVSEGLSLTLLEAMAAGLPIVATDVGGNREVVVHEETGLLVSARSPEQIASAMLRLFDDPELARRMGRAGRHRVEQEFDLRQVVARYESLYLSLLAAKGIFPPPRESAEQTDASKPAGDEADEIIPAPNVTAPPEIGPIRRSSFIH